MNRATEESEVLVVGAGPAGLAAAYRVAQSGKKVVVVDDNPDEGGQIWRSEKRKSVSPEASVWFERIRESNIRFIVGARVFQQPESGVLEAETSTGTVALHHSHLILATGARERFIPFPGWTLPNVMGAGGLQALVKTGLSIAGKKVVVAGSGPLLLAVANYLRSRGAEILLIAEQASRRKLARFAVELVRHAGKVDAAIRLRRSLSGIPYRHNCWPTVALGDDKLKSVILQDGQRSVEVSCDYLACGFHLVPNYELPVLIKCKTHDGFVAVDDFQETSVSGVFAAGETTGIGGLELSLIEGEIAGLAAANRRDEARKLFNTRRKQRRFAKVLHDTFELRKELKSLAKADTIVCRCEDVELDRLRPYDSWRAAKLQTRCGMGPCQGRVCGSAIEFMLGWQPESVRPPVFPVRVESMVRQQHHS